MPDLLIVASPTTVPLCTDVAVPTDGQPQWMLFPCGNRVRPHGEDRHAAGCYAEHGHGYDPDGPFPFTVARWAEVKRHCGGACGGVGCLGGGICTWAEGVITHLVEVTGPSHWSDECVGADGRFVSTHDFCDALPDKWHTPTGTVTVLDEPIPCERPRHTSGHLTAFTSRPPASVWVADEHVAERLRKVMA